MSEMINFKVGDKVVRKAEDRGSGWIERCRLYNIKPDDAVVIEELSGGSDTSIQTINGKDIGQWDINKFDLFKKMTKKRFCPKCKHSLEYMSGDRWSCKCGYNDTGSLNKEFKKVKQYVLVNPTA